MYHIKLRVWFYIISGVMTTSVTQSSEMIFCFKFKRTAFAVFNMHVKVLDEHEYPGACVHVLHNTY